MKPVKNIFGIMASKSTKETKFDGTKWIVKRIDKSHENEIKQALDFGHQQQQKGKSPAYFQVIRYVSWAMAVYLLVHLLRADMSLKEILDAAPGSLFLLFAFVFVAIVIQFYEASRMKKIMNTAAYKEFQEKVDTIVKRSLQQLEIPEDAKSIDVFTFTYRLDEQGNRIINTNKFFRFINKEMYVYVQNGKLCFADIYEVYAVPLTSLTEIKRHNQKVSMGNWNKKQHAGSEAFKPYNIKYNKYGTHFLQGYYSLLINDPKEPFELYIPAYDIDEVVRLTDLPVVDATEGEAEAVGHQGS